MVSRDPTYGKHLRAQEQRYLEGARRGAATRAARRGDPSPPARRSHKKPERRPPLEERVAEAHRGDRGEGRLPDRTRRLPRLGVGVFFLMREGQVVFVGSGMEVGDRVLTSGRGKKFDEVRYCPCSRGEMRRLEEVYIRFLRPVLNARSLTEPPLTRADEALLSSWRGAKSGA